MAVTFPAFAVGSPQRRRTYAVLRSLIRMDTAVPDAGDLPGQAENRGQIVINFPAMPDTIELARKANYVNQLTTPVSPDGLHIYDYTDPLHIPISFTLHGYDEDYCQQWGPLMLLSLAARLHALTLPILASTDRRASAPAVAQPKVGDADPAKRDPNLLTIGNTRPGGDVGFFQLQNSKFAFPPACALNIVMAQLGGSSGSSPTSNDGQTSLGINCVGFITDVRVLFKGPWLQGDFGTGGLRNLPTEAEFSFTFVHQPDYANKFGKNVSIVQASAADVYRRLYNTADLVSSGRDGNFAGLFEFEAQPGVPAALAPSGNSFQSTLPAIPRFGS